jgi:23S rRNA (cytosine1962-C5)-methyltransferase
VRAQVDGSPKARHSGRRLDIDLDKAIRSRAEFLAPPHHGAFRLFDGFRETAEITPLVLEIYGDTLVAFDHRRAPDDDPKVVEAVMKSAQEKLPFLRAGILKQKRADDPEVRRGHLIFGEAAHVTRRIEENGVRYAVDLLSHHDATFFLDTRNLRAFLQAESKGKRVLNAFAYSCSLGVAAKAGGASHVLQTDKNRTVLNLGKDSYSLNGFPISRADFVAGDFFDVAARLRKSGELFDTVVLDPPFFSDGGGGRVDLVSSVSALLDKARPIVGHEGLLIVVVNALFIPGSALMAELEKMVADGYATIERTIEVPADCAPPLGEGRELPADTAPFNHPTKIAMVRLRRKDGRG